MKALVSFSVACGLLVFACGGVDPNSVGGDDSSSSDDAGAVGSSNARRDSGAHTKDGGSSAFVDDASSGGGGGGSVDSGAFLPPGCDLEGKCPNNYVCQSGACVACGLSGEPCCLEADTILYCNGGATCGADSSGTAGLCI